MIVALSKEVEAALELGCIRPDLVTKEQVSLLAWELKNRTGRNEPQSLPNVEPWSLAHYPSSPDVPLHPDDDLMEGEAD